MSMYILVLTKVVLISTEKTLVRVLTNVEDYLVFGGGVGWGKQDTEE